MQRPIQIQVVATPTDAHNLSGATHGRKRQRDKYGGKEREGVREGLGDEVRKLNYNAQFGQSKTSVGRAGEWRRDRSRSRDMGSIRGVASGGMPKRRVEGCGKFAAAIARK